MANTANMARAAATVMQNARGHARSHQRRAHGHAFVWYTAVSQKPPPPRRPSPYRRNRLKRHAAPGKYGQRNRTVGTIVDTHRTARLVPANSTRSPHHTQSSVRGQKSSANMTHRRAAAQGG
eukprot:2301450-Prymnesium_polylepis.1